MTPHLAPAPWQAEAPGPARRAPGDSADAGSAATAWKWVALLGALSAIFAAATALISVDPPERFWGAVAACGYGAGAVAAIAFRHRGTWIAVLASLAGALLVPLGLMAWSGRAQPEVAVIARSAVLLLEHGSPYHGMAALAAAHTPYAYDPYLPVLTVFGLPRALAGGGLLTDPRIWFGVTFVFAFWGALSAAGVRRPVWWTIAVTASPVIAFPLSVGGDDLPVLGLECLGLALLGRGARRHRSRPLASGLVLGLATAMKATAWPALAVMLVLVAARHGRRATAWFSLAAFGVAGAAIASTAGAHPAAMAANTVLFPLGLARIKSPAASVLPGHLIASAWPGGGHWAAIALLVTAGLAVGVSLIIRPPEDERAAGWRLVLGLTLMFALAPATRIGYVVYPLGLSAWLLLAGGGGHTVVQRLERVCQGLSRCTPGTAGATTPGTATATRGTAGATTPGTATATHGATTRGATTPGAARALRHAAPQARAGDGQPAAPVPCESGR